MSDAANHTNDVSGPQLGATAAERRIGADEQLITLAEATRLTP